MTDELYEVSDLAFLENDTVSDGYGFDPILASGTPTYLMGIYPQSAGNHPMPKVTPYVLNTGNYQVNSVHRGDISVIETFTYLPVNGMDTYLAFCRKGAGIGEAGGLFTVSPISNGEIAEYAIRSESSSTSKFTREHIVGCKTMLYSEVLDRRIPNPKLSCVKAVMGQRRVVPGFDARNTPIYPQSTKDTYRPSNPGWEFVWDNGDGNIDYKNLLLNHRWAVNNSLEPDPIDGQLHPEFIGMGDQILTANFQIIRAGDDSIHDDYLDQLENGTTRDYRMKIYQDTTSTKYKEYEFKDFFMTECVENHFTTRKRVIPVWNITGIITSIIPTFKDGLNKTTFYHL